MTEEIKTIPEYQKQGFGKQEFKIFLRAALAGDGYTNQDIFIDDDKLDIVAEKYIKLVATWQNNDT